MSDARIPGAASVEHPEENLAARRAVVGPGASARRQSIDPGWHHVGLSLVRELSFRDFEQAFAFATRVANEAVDYLRRPDIYVFGFNRVRLTVANPNHAALTEAEYRLARKVDAILTAELAARL